MLDTSIQEVTFWIRTKGWNYSIVEEITCGIGPCYNANEHQEPHALYSHHKINKLFVHTFEYTNIHMMIFNHIIT